MKKIMARLMAQFIMLFLVLRLLSPAWAQMEPAAPAAPPPANQSPDSQRFQPVTPGQKIKLNSERVKRYQAVPPPEESPPPGRGNLPEAGRRPNLEWNVRNKGIGWNPSGGGGLLLPPADGSSYGGDAMA